MSLHPNDELHPLPKERYRCKFGEIDKLSDINFPQWVRNIRAFLRGENCLQIVLEQEEEPPADEYTKWKDYQCRKGVAYALIFASCTPEIQEYITGLDEPADMWNRLHEKLDTTASRAGRTMLARQFNQSKPNPTEPIQKYLSKLLQLRRRLAGTEQAITDEAFSSHLISTLPASFNSFVDIILHQPDGYTMENLISKVIEAEATASSRNNEQTSSNTSTTSGTALYTTSMTTSGNFRKAFRGGNRGGIGQVRGRGIIGRARGRGNWKGGHQEPISCWYCGVRGHRESDCRTKQRASMVKGTTRFNPPHYKASPASASVTRVQALVAGRSSSYQHEWVVDSVASHHICNTRSAFRNLRLLRSPVSILLGDCSEVFGIGKGEITLEVGSGLTLVFTALYAPAFSLSLLSISQLPPKYSIIFRSNTCFIADRKAAPEIKLAILENGLYRLRVQITYPNQQPRGKAVTALTTSKPTLELWHKRFGHIGVQSLRYILGESFPANASLPLCPTCVLGKQHQKIIRTPVPPVSRPFELVHSDVCGPISIPSFSGQRYFVVYVDDFSRRVWVYFVRSKESIEMTSVFQEFLARMEKAYPDWPIARFRCDNGRGEYDNRLFRGILRVSGISFEPAPPYTQHKNGKSERMIQTLVTKARTMLIDAKLPTAMWAEAISTAAYLHERSPSRPLQHRTPYEMLNQGKKPAFHHLRRFGCQAYKLVPPPQRKHRKFGERSRLCTMIGYVHDATTMWRLWDTEEKRMITASNVVFDEGTIVGDVGFEDVLKAVLPEEVYTDDEGEELEERLPSGSLVEKWAPSDIPSKIVDERLSADRALPRESLVEKWAPSDTPSKLIDENISAESALLKASATIDSKESSEVVPETQLQKASAAIDCEKESSEGVPATQLRLRRSCRIQAKTTMVAEESTSTTTDDLPSAVEILHQNDAGEPESYSEAASDMRWQEAMRAEYDSLKAHETFYHVTEDDLRPISCKWDFRLKTNADGSRRYKARLVATGFEQVHGVGYSETFAPVARLTTFRIYVATALELQATIYHLDVVTAFLNPVIEEPTAITVPEGIEWLDPKLAHELTPFSKLRLNKALYGLRQAPRLWYKDIATTLTTLGFSPSPSDPNLYFSKLRRMIILLYVDDILLCAQGNAVVHLDEVKTALKSKYQITDLGPAQQYLGITIRQSPTQTILSQSPYVLTLLKRFGLQDCNGHLTPLVPGSRTKRESAPLPPAEIKTYQAIVGGIMYLMLATRPDLAYSISVLSKHAANPQEHHLGMAKRVLRYLKRTAQLALVYTKASVSPEGQQAFCWPATAGFTDSDWAGDPIDRHSTAAFLFLCSGTAVSWKSKKQSLVALSTTEAEYVAASEASKEAVWLRRILSEIHGTFISREDSSSATPPIMLYIDNQAAIKLIKNPRFHERTKHIEIKRHYIRETYENGEILLQHTPTTEKIADAMTKPLSTTTFWLHVHQMGLQEIADP